MLPGRPASLQRSPARGHGRDSGGDGGGARVRAAAQAGAVPQTGRAGALATHSGPCGTAFRAPRAPCVALTDGSRRVGAMAPPGSHQGVPRRGLENRRKVRRGPRAASQPALHDPRSAITPPIAGDVVGNVDKHIAGAAGRGGLCCARRAAAGGPAGAPHRGRRPLSAARAAPRSRPRAREPRPRTGAHGGSDAARGAGALTCAFGGLALGGLPGFYRAGRRVSSPGVALACRACARAAGDTGAAAPRPSDAPGARRRGGAAGAAGAGATKPGSRLMTPIMRRQRPYQGASDGTTGLSKDAKPIQSDAGTAAAPPRASRSTRRVRRHGAASHRW
jgi:hypothetical protein